MYFGYLMGSQAVKIVTFKQTENLSILFLIKNIPAKSFENLYALMLFYH